jgi:hypothetical protein
LFDKTNTPRFENQDDIPRDLFTVATLSITMELESNVAMFCLESMACIQTRYILETHQFLPLIKKEHIVREQEIDRAVPGFQMGYRLFDCLMSLYANTHKLSPLEVGCTQIPGYEVVVCGNDVEMQKTDNTKGYSLSVLFSGLNTEGLIMDSDPRMPHKSIGDKCIFKERFKRGHYHKTEHELKLPVRLNQKWWSLAHGHYDSELASTCGCH